MHPSSHALELYLLNAKWLLLVPVIRKSISSPLCVCLGNMLPSLGQDAQASITHTVTGLLSPGLLAHESPNPSYHARL